MSEAYESIEVSAPTVDEAIKEALEKLGAAEDDVVIQVLATPRAGVLGLGSRPARVRVVRRPPEAASSGVTSPPPAPPPVRTPAAARTAEPPRQPGELPLTVEASPRPAVSERPSATERPRPIERPPARQGPLAPPRERYAKQPEKGRPSSGGHADHRPESRSQMPAVEERGTEEDREDDRKPADLDGQAREASAILTRILELMGERGEITVTEEDSEGIEVAIKGDGSGLLIGRHGQTLDALEYLVNRILARKLKDTVPITVDSESYRERRRNQLHRMALSMAEQTKREHATVTLEPMPPRDRRIVHLALKDDPLITTRSNGDGFLRAVEIVPVGERRDGGSGGRRERGGRGRQRERERPHEGERPRDNEREAPVGEQGGFKHGQKRII